MLVGVPKAIKTHESRVGLVPGAVREYVAAGHRVIVEAGAGAGISRARSFKERTVTPRPPSASAGWPSGDVWPAFGIVCREARDNAPRCAYEAAITVSSTRSLPSS